MKKSIINLTISLLAVVCLFSCAPTTEGEQQEWERNQATVKELIAEYPNFTQAIEAQSAAAVVAMEKAIQITEEEQKAEAMESANEMITKSFIGDLNSMRRRLDGIADKQIKLKSMRMQKAVVKRAETALEASYRAVDTVEGMLAMGSSSSNEAEKLAKEATSELIGAESRLSGAIRAAKKSMQKSKSSKKKNS